MEEKSFQNKRQTVFSCIILLVMLGLVLIMVIDLVPLMKQVLQDSDNEKKMIDYINAYGIKGAPILAGLQALQIILTVVPAAAIQILAGLCYGIWYGAIICIVGAILGNMIVFIVMRQMRNTFSVLFKDRAKTKEPKQHKTLSVDTLSRMKHPEYVSFFFYLIPGIPNGIIPYIFAQTKITFVKYILSISAANIPSVLLCTLLGQSISKGNYKTAVILAAVFLVILIFVLIFRKKITEKIVSLKD